MAPSDAIDNKFVQFLLPILQKLPIVFTVIQHLLLILVFLALIVASIVLHSCKNSHLALKQQQTVIQWVDFKLFKERSFHVSLDFELLCEVTVKVDSFQVLYDADFFAVIDLFVVLK